MDDVFDCPICKNKLRNIKLPAKYLHAVEKTADYVERTCTRGRSHSIQFFTNEETGKVEFLKISLNPKYSRYIEIDFINERSRISCMKSGRVEHIEIYKVLEPDFPDLVSLREKVALFVIFL